ncbi:MAG: hypothetical protein [Bacteriophage sp.]|nr:MAG: hypothetical protein [Bacteriophage sp.]
MAKNNKVEDIFNSPLSSSAKKAITKDINKNDNLLAITQNNLEKQDISRISEFEKTTASLNTSINNLHSKLTPVGGNNSDITNSELDGMLMLSKGEFELNKKSFNKNLSLSKKNKEELDKLKNSVSKNNRANLEQLMSLHKSKTMDSVATYNLIIKIIPKMRLALNTYATSILSPDDFTKNALTILVNQNNIDSVDKTRIIERTTDLLDKYNINKFVKNDIMQYLITGKMYYFVSTVNRELVKMLNEEANSISDTGIYSLLEDSYLSDTMSMCLQESASEQKTVFSNNKISALNEFKSLFNLKDDSDVTKAAKNVDNLIKEEFIIGDSTAFFDYEEEGWNGLTEKIDISDSFSNRSLLKLNRASDNTIEVNKDDDDELVKETDIKGLSKAVVKRISSANIIPLEFQNKIYGYIHLDIVEIDPDNDVLPIDNSNDDGSGSGFSPTGSSISANSLSVQNYVTNATDLSVIRQDNSGSGKGYENPSEANGLSNVDDLRLMFIAKTFANKLSKKTNLKFIKKNDILKNAIYNGLAVKKLCSNQKVRVVYLKPEEVVYINRGNSIFDNVLFFCKIYIATLITILMQNILNGGDRRAVYVEVGEDNNSAQAVNQVIKDIKSRDISSVMGMDIQSIMNIQNQFQDYYIPVVDGEKPISFETVDSLSNKNIDDEFLNWLGGQIYSGMGMPTAYLNEVENIDFAKLLSMQNSRYLREVLTEQNILSPGYTDLLRKLYIIEYGDSNNEKLKTKDNKTKVNLNSEEEPLSLDEIITPNMLEVKLPTPAALALITINDQMNNAAGIVDALLDNSNLVARANISADDIENVKAFVKNDLIRELVPSMPWSKIDAIIEQSINNYTEAKIKSDIKAENQEDVTDTETSDNLDSEI